MFVLAMQAAEHRAAVPGSLGRQIGILPAAAVMTAMVWGGPAVLALVFGPFGRPGTVEHGTAATPAASLPSWVAASAAGAAALACAVVMRAGGGE